MLKSIGHFVKLNSFPASIYNIETIQQVIHMSKHQYGEIFRGGVRSLFCAFQRLVGLLERAVNQAPGGI